MFLKLQVAVQIQLPLLKRKIRQRETLMENIIQTLRNKLFAELEIWA